MYVLKIKRNWTEHACVVVPRATSSFLISATSVVPRANLAKIPLIIAHPAKMVCYCQLNMVFVRKSALLEHSYQTIQKLKSVKCVIQDAILVK